LTAAAAGTATPGLFLVDANDTIFAHEDIESTFGKLNAEAIEIAISDSASQLFTVLEDYRHLRPRID